MTILDIVDGAIDRGSTSIVLSHKLYRTFSVLIGFSRKYKGTTIKYRGALISGG